MLNLLTLVLAALVVLGLIVMAVAVAVSLVVTVIGEIRATITANKAAKAAAKESAMPSNVKKTIVTLVALFALFPVSAFAATTTPESAMTIDLVHLKLIWFFACAFAVRAFFEEFMLNRKIKALTADLGAANATITTLTDKNNKLNIRLGHTFDDLVEAEANLHNTSVDLTRALDANYTHTRTIESLNSDVQWNKDQATSMANMYNNLAKTVATVTTALIALFFALPAHAAAPWQFAADAGQLPDMVACACLAAMAFAGVTAAVLVADLLIRKAILAITNITTKAISAATLENVMPILTMFVLAILGLILALFPAIANAATSITMNNDGLTINVMDSAVLSYLAWIVGTSLIAIIGAILCEVIVRHTRTICKLLGLVAVIMMIPSVADAASLTATTATTYAIIGAVIGLLGLFFIGALTVTRHEIAAGIIATFSVFAIFPVGIIGTEMGIDKTILTNVISGILIWVMLAFVVLQICMLPGRKADKAAAAAKKAQWNLIIRKADEKRENTRLDTWYDRAEYADSLNQLSRDARVAVLRGKPYWTNQSVMSAADKACGYRRAVLTR